VQVEVVLLEVRKDQAGEPGADEPAVVRAMRGRLECAAAIARVEHLAKRALEVDRLGRRAGGGPPLAADAALDRPQQPGAPPRGLEDRVQEEGGRRLAARAGHGRDLQLVRRPREELRGCQGHGLAHVGDDRLRDADRERPRDDKRSRARRDGALREVVPVGALPRDAEEQRPRPDRTAVVCEVLDLDRGVADNLAGRKWL
jgi:hypothetical protein